MSDLIPSVKQLIVDGHGVNVYGFHQQLDGLNIPSKRQEVRDAPMVPGRRGGVFRKIKEIIGLVDESLEKLPADKAGHNLDKPFFNDISQYLFLTSYAVSVPGKLVPGQDGMTPAQANMFSWIVRNQQSVSKLIRDTINRSSVQNTVSEDENERLLLAGIVEREIVMIPIREVLGANPEIDFFFLSHYVEDYEVTVTSSRATHAVRLRFDREKLIEAR